MHACKGAGIRGLVHHRRLPSEARVGSLQHTAIEAHALDKTLYVQRISGSKSQIERVWRRMPATKLAQQAFKATVHNTNRTQHVQCHVS
jgi:hypothetical protein